MTIQYEIINLSATIRLNSLILFQEFYIIDVNNTGKMNTNACSHWACNAADNTCIGCGIIVCPLCLKEPVNCKCENKDTCCAS